MEIFDPTKFLFSSKHRLWNHLVFWVTQVLIFTIVWFSQSKNFWGTMLGNLMWVPIDMLYCYPLIYWVLPGYLLKGKYFKFILIMAMWIIAGWFYSALLRFLIFIPLQERLHLSPIGKGAWHQGSFLAMGTTAAFVCMIALFKYWTIKQQEWLLAQKEKITAELELLKAQIHPHFLFNTLNNIYAFSLENSSKTPGLILKLSSLLSYMLFECNAEQVMLSKEIEVMRDYIDLEKERYGNKIKISIVIKGDVRHKYITPLLLLPFLENAFKHGTSDQLEKPWLSIKISVVENSMEFQIVNSKNEDGPVRRNGIGIQNVKRRLQFLYPHRHELKLNNEGDYFDVYLLVKLDKEKKEDNPLFPPAAIALKM